jgi:probable F420-dependent oxidoreductase
VTGTWRVDTALQPGADAGGLHDIAAVAQQAEADGYDALWASEVDRDPFLPLLVAAEHTQRLHVGTAIAVAFARTPMTLATLANDLHQYSQGRFLLGLGSQIKPHVERRFSMPWSRPAARMRELIIAIRAIWHAWETGEPLHFTGEFYTHTLMTPFFSPGPNPHGNPPILLAAVGPAMTTVAAEVADGLLVHGFTTERYLRQETLPAVAAGLAASGRAREDFQVVYPAFVVTGATDAEMATAADAVRAQLAFYGSTPAYRPVLAAHGWQSLADELHRLSRGADADRWQRMAALIDDEVLDAFAVVAAPGAVAGSLRARFGDLVDRISFYAPYPADPQLWADVRRDLA